jgi:hypothetical protein
MRFPPIGMLLLGISVVVPGRGDVAAGELRLERVFGPEVPTGPY